MRRYRFLAGAIGATLLALATVSPETATANLAAWMGWLFGVAATPFVNVWTTLGTVVAGILFLLLALAWHAGKEPD